MLDVNTTYFVYNFEKARITLPKILLSSNINHKALNAKSFGYVTGLKYSSFNAIKVFKATQRNGKDSANVDGLLVEYLRQDQS